MDIRWRMGSGPNAENNGHATLPCLSAPNTAMYSSGHASEQGEHATPAGDAELVEHFGEFRRAKGKVPEGEVLGLAVAAEPPDRQLVTALAAPVTIDTLVGDIEAATGQPIEHLCASFHENEEYVSS